MKILLSLVLFLLLALGGLIYSKNRQMQNAVSIPTCLRWEAPEHHRYAPNCQGHFTYKGAQIDFSSNEDGLRERPRALIRAGQVLVLGDSMVEGWGITREAAIPARLEASLGKELKKQFINGAIRSSGTVLQSQRALRLLSIYKPRHVVWFLNDYDVLDDRFAYALATKRDAAGVPSEFGLRDMEAAGWIEPFRRLEKVFPDGWALLSHLAYRWAVDSLTERQPEEPGMLCAGIKRVERAAAAFKAPVFYVAVPLGVKIPEAEYARFNSMVEACLPKERFLDLRGPLAGKTEYFIQENAHFSPLGAETAAGLAAGRLRAFLGGGK